MTVRVGVIGLGFMGRTHLGAYRAAIGAGHDARVVAVADINIDRVGEHHAGNISTAESLDLSGLRTTSRAEELIESKDLDVLSICTPTDTHVDLACRALAAGKHVLLEKPVALRAGDVLKVEAAARASGRLCMPAMCMRFWPGWTWLREQIVAGTFGRVLSATFHRLGSAPDWNPSFYGDASRSGGALVDLHIHDADFVAWCFGRPDAVSSVGGLRHVTTQYKYKNGPSHVIAEGGQDHANGFGFRMRYLVAFEHAAAEFDLSRTPQLTLFRAGGAETIPTDGPGGYEAEVAHFVGAVASDASPDSLRATLADAHTVTQILEAERRSIELDTPQPV